VCVPEWSRHFGGCFTSGHHCHSVRQCMMKAGRDLDALREIWG